MSGVFKGIKKIFKKITKSTIGKILLGVVAAVFTAGIGTAVLGAAGASAGFMSSTMGTVLANGISGAVAGGLTSGLAGGDVLKGMAFGGLGGALVGGVKSYLNATPTADAAISNKMTADNTFAVPKTPPPGTTTTANYGPPGTSPAGTTPTGGMTTAATQGSVQPVSLTPTNVPSGFEQAVPTPVDTANMSFLESVAHNIKKPTFQGLMLSGALSGGAAMMANSGGTDTAAEMAWREQERASHSGVHGLLSSPTNPVDFAGAPTPAQRWDRWDKRDSSGSNSRLNPGHWAYDPRQGTSRFMPYRGAYS